MARARHLPFDELGRVRLARRHLADRVGLRENFHHRRRDVVANASAADEHQIRIDRRTQLLVQRVDEDAEPSRRLRGADSDDALRSQGPSGLTPCGCLWPAYPGR